MNRDMESHDADVIIIGGGIMGLFTSIALTERGVDRVIMLEKSHVGAGSSGRSGAILRQHYSHSVTICMARESMLQYQQFESHTGHDIGYTQVGMLFLACDAQRTTLEVNVELQRSLGVDVELLEHSALCARFPELTLPDDAIAALEHEAAYVDPVSTLNALRQDAIKHGVDVRTQTQVADIMLTPDRRVRGVTLADGTTIHAPIVVNTAGPWAGRLCDRLGIVLPLTVVRPQQAFFRAPTESDAYAGPILGDMIAGIYRKPEANGWIRAGRLSYARDTVVDDPDHFDETIDPEFAHEIRQAMVSRLPAFAEATFWAGGSCLYTTTPDAHPVVGGIPGVDGLFIAAGFSGHGFKLGPSIGRGLAAMITGSSYYGAFDPAFFAVNRFVEHAETTTAYEFSILG